MVYVNTAKSNVKRTVAFSITTGGHVNITGVHVVTVFTKTVCAFMNVMTVFTKAVITNGFVNTESSCVSIELGFADTT